MRSMQAVLSAVTVLVGLAHVSAAERPSDSNKSQRDDLPVLVYRGVTPGRTTEKALLSHPQWGKPDGRDSIRNKNITLLRYQVSEFPVVIAVRDGVVRSLDVLFPEGATIDEAVRIFKLENPLPEAPLPRPAQIGEPIPQGLKARQYGNRRVVLFVEKDAEHPLARRVRFYGSEVGVQTGRSDQEGRPGGKIVRELPKDGSEGIVVDDDSDGETAKQLAYDGSELIVVDDSLDPVQSARSAWLTLSARVPCRCARPPTFFRHNSPWNPWSGSCDTGVVFEKASKAYSFISNRMS